MMETSGTDRTISDQLGSVERFTVEPSGPSSHFSHLVNTSGESNEQNNDIEAASNLVFYEKIPSLQEMASGVVAVALWRRVISFKYSKRYTVWYPTFDFVHKEDENEVLRLIEDLPVPRLIRHLVENSINCVRSEMNEWARYFVQSVFMTNRSAPEDPIEVSDLLFCHWLPNCTIDHRKTALNMLSNPRLTSIDKFKIMCKYCFEDEIKKLPLESISERYTEKVNFVKNPLMYYWICYMKGDLQKLPRKNDESVECFLITAFNVDSWPAIEYFWNRLNFNEQLSKALILLNRKPQFQRQLFSKMDEFQKNHVLSAMPFEITMNFWKQKSQERFAYLIWIRIKDTITFDQFTKFIYAFLTESLPNRVEKLRYLVKMWHCSSDCFKNRALNSMRNTMIGLHAKYYNISPCNLEFLLVFLSYGSVEFRKTVMIEQGCSLTFYNDFSMIDQLIELCLPDPNDVAEFKNILVKSENVRRHCCSLLDNSDDDDLEQLTKFVDHYSPDPNAKIEFVKRILESWTIDGCTFLSLKRWNRVIEFIDEYILETLPDQATKFKKRIAWAFVNYCARCWSNDDELRKFIVTVDRVLEPEDLNKFKASVIGTLRDHFRWNQFEDERVRSLLSWCFDNDDLRIKEFKKSVPIDDIFAYNWDALKWNHFGGDPSLKSIYEIFTPIDKILLWYFEDLDLVKKYKLGKVFGSGNSGVEMFVKYRGCIDEEFTRIALPWFFDGDKQEIRKFKEKYKDHVISDMIDVDCE